MIISRYSRTGQPVRHGADHDCADHRAYGVRDAAEQGVDQRHGELPEAELERNDHAVDMRPQAARRERPLRY